MTTRMPYLLIVALVTVGALAIVTAPDAATQAEIRKARAWASTAGARCVHSHEGGLRSNTGNGYYGRWQADISFQYAYGREFVRRWGYAHNWPAWAQDVMAWRGWKARGWNPWPTTSRMCGLR